MPMWEYGLKTGNLSEEEMVKCFEKALTRAAKATSDLHIAKSRKKLRKYTGPFGRSTPDAEPPDYDHIYFFNSGHRGCYMVYVHRLLLWSRPVPRDFSRSGGGKTRRVWREFYAGIVPSLSR